MKLSRVHTKKLTRWLGNQRVGSGLSSTVFYNEGELNLEKLLGYISEILDEIEKDLENCPSDFKNSSKLHIDCFKCYFGLMGTHPMSLNEVSMRLGLGVSSDRVCHRIQKAMAMIKSKIKAMDYQKKSGEKDLYLLFLGHTRILNAFRSKSIMTKHDLVAYTEPELLRVPDIGKESVKIIKNKLADVGLRLRDS